MNIYKWTVTIDGNEGALMDDVDEAHTYAMDHAGIVTEYEFEYSDSYVISDYGGEQHLAAAEAGSATYVEEEVPAKGPHTCVLCGGVFTGYGNNPEPLADWPARCCDICNDIRVIPARIALITNQHRSEG